VRTKLSVLGLALLVSGCSGHAARLHTAFDASAAQDLSAISRGDCAGVVRHFDPLMARLTAPQLCAGYRDYTEQFGTIERKEAAYSTRRGALVVVRIPLRMQHASGE
jgi:hypothetical protein